MLLVQPQVFRIAQTQIHEPGLQAMLEHLGVPDWTTDAKDEHSKLAEVSGRLCYLSFEPGLNKNVTKVREGNEVYLENIINSKHGSVTEHATVTYAIMDVSRVFTHELVRHRVGTAFSQLSGRYVRADQIRFFYPRLFTAFGSQLQQDETYKVIEQTIQTIEGAYLKLEAIWGIDQMKDFGTKKKLTSAFRRICPNGQTNHIVLTANHRMFRFMTMKRSHRSAEEEIRFVFGDLIFPDLYAHFRALYQDAEVNVVDGYNEITFKNGQI
jgi:thymidylate synthase (FAD)